MPCSIQGDIENTVFLSVFSFAKKKRLRATDVWFQDMLEIESQVYKL